MAPEPTGTGAARTIALLATESSGDVLGASLIAALRASSGTPLHFTGLAGPMMQAAGCSTLFPIHELSLMGIAEVVPHLPRLLRRIRETVAFIRRTSPDVVVTIDGPGFNFRVAKALRAAGYTGRLIHVVAPSVWAWKPGRARKIARWYDHLLALLPFEPPYFTAHGLATTFIGHPILDSGANRGNGAAFRAQHALAEERPLLAVLPGSRRGEVSRLLPVFAATVARLVAERPDLAIAIPAVAHVQPLLAHATRSWAAPVIVCEQQEKYDLMAASTAALAASGTVTVELALAGVPTVVAYRMHPLTAMIARQLVKVRYASLVNILGNAPILPEFLQDACTAEALTPAVGHFLAGAGVADFRTHSQSALALLRPAGTATPAERAAAIILQDVCG